MGVNIETIKAGDGATFPQKGQKVTKYNLYHLRSHKIWPRSPAIMSWLWREERRWIAPVTAAGHSSSPWVRDQAIFNFQTEEIFVVFFRQEGGYWGLGAGHRPDVIGSESQANYLQWPGLWPSWPGTHPRGRHPPLRCGADDDSVTRWIRHPGEFPYVILNFDELSRFMLNSSSFSTDKSFDSLRKKLF